MADTKISALTALTGANAATDDEVAVVDTSATATKRMTLAELAKGFLGATLTSLGDILYRGTNTLEQRNGTGEALQSYSLYSTYTDGSNYSRARFYHESAATFIIGTEAAGTGGNQNLVFRTSTGNVYIDADNTYIRLPGSGFATSWRFSSSALLAGADNTYDIGAAADNRPRYIRAASALVSPSTVVGSLPAAATAGAGARSFVTDASATTFLSTVAGGGANKVPVVSDGTNWLIG